jgi:hypothetical protein
MGLLLPLLMVGLLGIAGVSQVLFSVNGATYSSEQAITVLAAEGNNSTADQMAIATLRAPNPGVASTNSQSIQTIQIFEVVPSGTSYVMKPSTLETYRPSGACISGCGAWPAAGRPTSISDPDLAGITITYNTSILWGMGGSLKLTVTRYARFEPQS